MTTTLVYPVVLLSRVVGSVRRRGFRETVSRATEKIRARAGPIWFDLRHGTDTAGIVRRAELNVRSPNLIHAQVGDSRDGAYEGIAGVYFRTMMREQSLPRDGVFLDVGAGKGKALVLAAQSGFRRLVGVEFSENLCRIARRNLSIAGRRLGVELDVRIVHADAAEYEVDDDANVIFLYNPFDDVVLAIFLENVRRSLERRPRNAWLLYVNPVHRRLVDGLPFLKPLRTFRFAYQRAEVYVSCGRWAGGVSPP